MAPYRIYIFLSFFFFSMAVSYGQHQNDNWYFGKSSAISFQGGIAQPKFDNANPQESAASVSISDSITGELLFYSNGINIRNGKHEIVKDSLLGLRKIQEMIAIPRPGKLRSYYLVFLSAKTSTSITPILGYYVVDIHKDGKVKVTENIQLIASGDFSTLNAVRNCQSNGHWLLLYNSNTSTVFSYGIDSSIALFSKKSPMDSNLISTSQLITNNTGEYLAIGVYNIESLSSGIKILRIDKHCGRIAVQASLKLDQNLTVKGLSFSENSKYLYASCTGINESKVIQFKWNLKKRRQIYSTDYMLDQMRLAPDGKIYLSSNTNGFSNNTLDVINSPNLEGIKCNYVPTQLSLGSGQNSAFHLPKFIQDTTKTFCPSYHYEFKLEDVCEGQAIQIELVKNAYFWPFNSFKLLGKDTSFFDLIPTIPKLPIGQYIFRSYFSNCSSSDSIDYAVRVLPPHDIDLSSDTSICRGDSIVLKASSVDSVKFLWPHSGSTKSTHWVSDTGYYFIETERNGCIAKDSVKIGWHPELWTALEEEYYICEDDQELIRIEAKEGYNSYLWYPTGDTTQWIVTAKADSYFVVLSDFRGCKGSDKTTVKEQCDGELYFPNAFSPNGDGTNDFFDIDGSFVSEFELKIFNRWGEKVFESDDLRNSWDGFFNGQECPVDGYLWHCSYRTLYLKEFDKIQFKSGMTFLIR